MIDFLRANPWCSREEYTWGMSMPQIELASVDFSHVEYLKTKEEKEREKRNIKIMGGDDIKRMVALRNDLGIPVIKGH